MKNRTNSIPGLIIGFLASIFAGVVVVSIGLGAAFPSINRVAKPFVCPHGELAFDRNVSSPMPGETYATIVWYCDDQALDYFSVVGSAGVLYGLACFPLFLLIRYFFQRWDESLEKQYASQQGPKRRK
jgi:hypothetical protein